MCVCVCVCGILPCCLLCVVSSLFQFEIIVSLSVGLWRVSVSRLVRSDFAVNSRAAHMLSPTHQLSVIHLWILPLLLTQSPCFPLLAVCGPTWGQSRLINSGWDDVLTVALQETLTSTTNLSAGRGRDPVSCSYRSWLTWETSSTVDPLLTDSTCDRTGPSLLTENKGEPWAGLDSAEGNE